MWMISAHILRIEWALSTSTCGTEKNFGLFGLLTASTISSTRAVRLLRNLANFLFPTKGFLKINEMVSQT